MFCAITKQTKNNTKKMKNIVIPLLAIASLTGLVSCDSKKLFEAPAGYMVIPVYQEDIEKAREAAK
jgi:hypothetical protein